MRSFIKICLICIIGIYRLKETRNICKTTSCHVAAVKISAHFSILSLAAILVGSWDHRTQFWKGAIQESFQQSLVEIDSVVSEEKIFFKFHPPVF